MGKGAGVDENTAKPENWPAWDFEMQKRSIPPSTKDEL
jgi:hypothetical protein